LPVFAVCDIDNSCTLNNNGDLRFFITNITNNQPITSANCYIFVYYPNNTLVTGNNTVSEFSNGFYNYTISGNETSDLGQHYFYVSCYKDIYYSSYANSYQMVGDLSYNYFGNWNNWIYNIYTNVTVASSQLMVNILNYLQNQLNVNVSENSQNSIANKTWEVNITTTTIPTSPPSIWDIPADKLRKYLGE
jgi:hypothetical protein